MSGQIHPSASTVDVGTLPSSFQKWESVMVYFHGFEDLSSVRGERTISPHFTCLGNHWYLSIYPGGRERSNDGNVSLGLQNFSDESTKMRYRFIVRNSVDKEVIVRSSTGVGTTFAHYPSGGSYLVSDNCVGRSTIIDALVTGSLTIEVRMKRTGETKSSSVAYVPENPLYKNILNKFMDEESSDVLFKVDTGRKQGENYCKKAKIAPAKFYAHRFMLQHGAPILAQFCKPGGDSCKVLVSITDVDPDIFQQALHYVYGGKVSEDTLKSRAKDVIDAADKYGIVSLKLEAEAYYVESTWLHIGNILDNFLFAESKNCALLKEAVMDFIAKNGDGILGEISFENVPGLVVTDLLLAVGRSKRQDDVSNDPNELNAMRVAALRRRLSEKGLDVDGSREEMIALLKENS